MGRYSASLGYGTRGDYEVEVFTRLLTNQIQDDEEVRMDKPSDHTNSFEYAAVAPSGSSVDDMVWNCIRCTWINNRCSRLQFQVVSWTNRSQGWPS